MAPSARKPTLTRRAAREAQAADAAAGTRGKPAQRERLMNAMIELSAKAGYQAVSIAQVSSHAGVSSATFYEQFEDKEDCLLAAYDVARERVLREAARECPARWADAARASLTDLSEKLQDDPDAGSMVFVEALAGEARMRHHRETVLERDEISAGAYLAGQPAGTAPRWTSRSRRWRAPAATSSRATCVRTASICFRASSRTSSRGWTATRSRRMLRCGAPGRRRCSLRRRRVVR